MAFIANQPYRDIESQFMQKYSLDKDRLPGAKVHVASIPTEHSFPEPRSLKDLELRPEMAMPVPIPRPRPQAVMPRSTKPRVTSER